MKRFLVPLLLAISFIFGQCASSKKIPAETAGGVYSLNGTWRLEKTNDNNALIGSTVTVQPGVTDAPIRTLSNNAHCFKEKDVAWRSLRSSGNGSFVLENLVDACNNSTVYRTALITFLNSNKIRLDGQKDVGGQLTQTWVRVTD